MLTKLTPPKIATETTLQPEISARKKDWTGNKHSVFATLGASSHTDGSRPPNDYYATDPKAAELLLELETFSPNIWECACGEGHLSKVFEKAGYNVRSTDLVDRGFGTGGIDFLSDNIQHWDGDIITNPPYRHAQLFVEKALSIISPGMKVVMFLRVQFLEGKRRKKMYEKHPPKVVYISSSRLRCAKNGEFKGSSAVAFAWFVWVKGFRGEPVIRWFN